MSINRDSCDCRRVDLAGEEWFTQGAARKLERPGDFAWIYGNGPASDPTDLVLFIPGNEGGSIAPIPVVRGPHENDRWGWNGNEDRPNLAPSIWRNAPSKAADGITEIHHRNEWHGHLWDGRLVST